MSFWEVFFLKIISCRLPPSVDLFYCFVQMEEIDYGQFPREGGDVANQNPGARREGANENPGAGLDTANANLGAGREAANEHLGEGMDEANQNPGTERDFANENLEEGTDAANENRGEGRDAANENSETGKIGPNESPGSGRDTANENLPPNEDNLNTPGLEGGGSEPGREGETRRQVVERIQFHHAGEDRRYYLSFMRRSKQNLTFYRHVR